MHGFCWKEAVKGFADLARQHSLFFFTLFTTSLKTHSVGYGDICPGETDTNGKLFLLLFSFAGLGFIGGPIIQLGAAWRHALPGGRGALASFMLGLGVIIFTSVEGLEHFDAMYASIITGEWSGRVSCSEGKC